MQPLGKSQRPRNDFEHVRNAIAPGGGGVIPYGLLIHCRECRKSEVVPILRACGQTCEQAVAERTVRNHGWTVGRSRKFDVCPACVEKDKASREARRARESPPKLAAVMPPALIEFAAVLSPAPESIVVPLHPKESIVEASPQTKRPPPFITAEPPPQIGIEDRRVIFTKLNDVYLDGARGYSAGWSDVRVAKELGIPRAWVSSVRAEFFGAEACNEEVASMVADGRKLLADALAAEKRAETMLAEAKAERGRIATLIADFEKRLVNIEKAFRP